MAHVQIPGFVPLHKYISRAALEGLEQLIWLATDDENSPLFDAIEKLIPDDEIPRSERIKALREVGVVVQDARRKKGQGW